jgi:membrane-associated phospholipid phosphatase
MIEQLIKLDHYIFYAINTGLSNSFFDFIMPILRNKIVWIPLYIFIIAYCIKVYKLKGLYLVLVFAATVGLTDFVNSSVIKNYFKRTRPCNEVAFQSQVISRVPCGSGKSFPSSHASDHFAIAVFLITIFYKKWKAILPIGILWAGSISFAQVYVGVHFPVDIFFGALLGSAIAYFGAKTYLKYSHFQV